MTYHGGSHNNANCFYACGVVFQLTPPVLTNGAWAESVIYNFPDLIGAFPTDMTLALDRAGNLYGTTQYLGRFGIGTIFRLVAPQVQGTPWKEQTLYSFTGGVDQFYPMSGVILDGVGNLYGTTNGSQTANGVVYQLAPPRSGGSWTFNLMHTFAGGPADGAHSQTPLISDGKGGFYGTTLAGGSSSLPYCSQIGGCGVAFEVTPAGGGNWNEIVLHSFGAASNDGQRPEAALSRQGNLVWGTASQGGDNGDGVAFAIRP